MAPKLYTYLVLIQFGLGIIILPILLFFGAPYGRHFRVGFGPVMHSRTAWLLMEFPAVIVIAGVYFWKFDQQRGNLNWVFLVMWQTHYLYRTFIYPWLLRGSRRTFPWLLAFFALGFNFINGFINGYALFILRPVVTLEYFMRFWPMVGAILFIGGLVLHIQSDATIRNLRRHLEYNGKGRYGIPNGGLFKFVSNPHYLGEIVEWLGWAVMANNPAGWAFAWFSLANLLPRAIHNHSWYLKTFANYPKTRKVIIPFVF